MKLDGEYLIYGEKSNQIVGAGLAGDKVRQALVGRFNYDYKGRYMVDFSFRYDGSSSLPEKFSLGILSCCICRLACQRRGLYEKSGVPFLSNLKIRASYGEMGDDGSANTYPQTAVAYELNPSKLGYVYNGVLISGVSATSIPNPDLTWYTAKTYNLGVDFDLWEPETEWYV